MVNLEPEAQRRQIAKALLDTHPDAYRLYDSSGVFHHGIKFLVGLLPEFVEFLATKGAQTEAQAEIVRSALERGDVQIPAGDATISFISEVVAAQAQAIRDGEAGTTPPKG
jgi:hypothetical protein